MKAKYNPTPTAREKAYHIWLMDAFDCICGCGGKSETVHHPLTRHPAQRWRRDHEFGVPMTDACHRALHAMGSEQLFAPEIDFAAEAYAFRYFGIERGLL